MTLKVLHLIFRWRVVLVGPEGLVLSFDQSLGFTVRDWVVGLLHSAAGLGKPVRLLVP
jgi:hypothetical protein